MINNDDDKFYQISHKKQSQNDRFIQVHED